ncbi:HIT zinc finger [Haloplanus vescus]|uniref:HIT zinc finger n=1 Tax=Haloplanus vescus TaxID=555874 RepID=A0A1H4AHU5_9EURY|nr:zinc finger HIT domain-containing protein [Haloplanus vescus]SEA35447.1 HIT zinc finger [Haloplanus vescus]
MSVTTLCQVCESATARYTCDACGAAVCPAHYDRESGLCAGCAGGLR